MRVAIVTPTLAGPHEAYVASLKATHQVLGGEYEFLHSLEWGCPYISAARANLTRKALDAGADTIVYIDHDIEWTPDAPRKLIEAPYPVVAGTYRYKQESEDYMGTIDVLEDGRPNEKDGFIKAWGMPAGFLKITREGVRKFMRAYPELIYGDPERPSIDLFNHGAKDGIWWGEDIAFSQRWVKIDTLWCLPDLDLTHHSGEPYPGNFHEYLLRQPGGSNHERSA